MEKIVLAKAILAVLLSKSPAEQAGTYETWPENRETPAEKRERFEAKADAIAEVVLAHPRVKDPEWAASLVAAVQWHEGGLTKHVDTGEGAHARGDGGQSVCGMQVRVGKGQTAEGWKAEDLLADQRKCITAGLNLIMRSMPRCKEQPDGQLATYAGGNCREKAVAASATRMRTAREFLLKLRQARPATEDKKGS